MTRPLVDNTADAGQIREGRRKERLAADQKAADLEELGQSPAFVRYMVATIERCGVYRTTFDQNTTQMAFNEGQRNVGLMLTADLERANPTALLDLLRARTLTET